MCEGEGCLLSLFFSLAFSFPLTQSIMLPTVIDYMYSHIHSSLYDPALQ